ncbi:YcdB/YcdC domain-containing protein [Bacillus manliponensis]|uniref:YcdB/YcdC domain-containing protein n=1 Tax=Bacillus manliponensis TaxID=574376 RepID=UPI003513F663
MESRNKVEHLVTIPDDYKLVVDDIKDEKHILWWEQEENCEQYIHICFKEKTNQLIELSINKESPKEAITLSEAEGKKIAERFLQTHAPHILKECNMIQVEKRESSFWVEYMQEVNGYELPHTGAFLKIDSSKVVTKFGSNGINEKPIWPKQIVDKEYVIEKLNERQEMELVFKHLYSNVDTYKFETVKEGYALVYEPVFSHASIDAQTGEDLHDRSHYVIETVPIPPIQKEQRIKFDINEYFKIDEGKMKKVREVEDETCKKVMWAETFSESIESSEGDKSVDAYLYKKLPILQYEKSIIIEVDKETDELISYIEMGKEDIKPVLTRAQCFEKVLQFLQNIYPNVEEQLRLWMDEDDEEENPYHFKFHMYVNGIRLVDKWVWVAVDAASGKIVRYKGVPRRLLQKLSTYDTNVSISEQEALAIYMKETSVKLKWLDEGEDTRPKYRLIYTETTAKKGDNKESLRYIDAENGKVIYWK